jgi:hypothetical protein
MQFIKSSLLLLVFITFFVSVKAQLNPLVLFSTSTKEANCRVGQPSCQFPKCGPTTNYASFRFIAPETDTYVFIPRVKGTSDLKPECRDLSLYVMERNLCNRGPTIFEQEFKLQKNEVLTLFTGPQNECREYENKPMMHMSVTTRDRRRRTSPR